jgi:hypothetical protein
MHASSSKTFSKEQVKLSAMGMGLYSSLLSAVYGEQLVLVQSVKIVPVRFLF